MLRDASVSRIEELEKRVKKLERAREFEKTQVGWTATWHSGELGYGYKMHMARVLDIINGGLVVGNEQDKRFVPWEDVIGTYEPEATKA